MRLLGIPTVAMKVTTSVLGLACLAAVTLCAVSSHAQDARSQLPTRNRVPAASSTDMSAANALAKQLRQKGATPLPTETCSYQFTTGSGNTYLQFCVTVNGNIIEFNSPQGVEQLSPQGMPAFEGYSICDATAGVAYYDYAYGDSGNWGAPVLNSHTATSVKITRTTSDGLWTLIQTITMVPGPPANAKMTMAVKNNSAITRGVELVRYANALPDNSGNTGDPVENYDGTLNGAFGWLGENGTANGGPYGLLLQEEGVPSPTTVFYNREGFAINTSAGPDPCNSAANWIGPITNNEGSLVYWYDFTLKKAQTVTVNEEYLSY